MILIYSVKYGSIILKNSFFDEEIKFNKTKTIPFTPTETGKYTFNVLQISPGLFQFGWTSMIAITNDSDNIAIAFNDSFYNNPALVQPGVEYVANSITGSFIKDKTYNIYVGGSDLQWSVGPRNFDFFNPSEKNYGEFTLEITIETSKFQEAFDNTNETDKTLTRVYEQPYNLKNSKMIPFTPDATGTYSFSTQDSEFDTAIALTNNSDNIAIGVNNDENLGFGENLLTSFMSLHLIKGTPYRLYVGNEYLEAIPFKSIEDSNDNEEYGLVKLKISLNTGYYDETFNTQNENDKDFVDRRIIYKAKMISFTPDTTDTYSFFTQTPDPLFTTIALTNNSDNMIIKINSFYDGPPLEYQDVCSYFEASLIAGTTYRIYVGTYDLRLIEDQLVEFNIISSDKTSYNFNEIIDVRGRGNVKLVDPTESITLIKAKMISFTPDVTAAYLFEVFDSDFNNTIFYITNNFDDIIILSNYDREDSQSYMKASLNARTTYRIYVGGVKSRYANYGSVRFQISRIN